MKRLVPRCPPPVSPDPNILYLKAWWRLRFLGGHAFSGFKEGGNIYTLMWQLWQMWQFRQLWHKRIYKLKGAIVANVANVANQDE